MTGAAVHNAPAVLSASTPLADLENACRADPSNSAARILHAMACANAATGIDSCPYADGAPRRDWIGVYRRVEAEAGVRRNTARRQGDDLWSDDPDGEF
ncbi:hypothetical protein [Pacificispira sp.]|uniref:hypothetical protein n=1 Tax=Pacificispira sp. TaxID=2888761 RepID=UPI003BA8748D